MDEEEAWYRQQKLLLEAEEKRRKLIAEEEQKLVDQRTRLAALDRETNMKKVHLMDATRRKFLAFQQHQKEAELTRLDDEIRRKVGLQMLLLSCFLFHYCPVLPCFTVHIFYQIRGECC